MLNIPVPEKWDGVSFLDAIKGKDFQGRDYLVFDHGIYTLQRSVRTKDYLFMKTLHPGLYPINEPHWLFDMNKDLHLTTDIADKNPEVVKECENIILKWKDEQLPKHIQYPDPLEEMVQYGPFLYYKPKEMIDRLKERVWNKEAEELINRLKKYHKGEKSV
jgi:hypothetical protein